MRPSGAALLRRRPARGVRAAGELSVASTELFAAGTWAVEARLAKAAGVPEGFSDVLTLSVRIALETGLWDLVLATIGPFGRSVPVPARGWTEAVFSSLTPYRAGERSSWVLAQAAADQPRVDASLRAARRLVRGGGFELVLAVAAARGVPHRVGTLRLATPRADDDLRFDPPRHHPPGARPSG